MKFKLFAFLIFFIISAGLPFASHAFTYSKNIIITDYEMTNASALSLKGINDFLAEKGSVLSDYITADINGKSRTVAKIIHRVSNKYALNPMLFLVMAQKESSAITRSSMSYAIENWILGYGRCDSCSEKQAAPYKGIAKQFESAAAGFRDGYLADLESRGYTVSGWGPGITKTTIDGISVTPKNDATAALYTYNPCVGAYGGGYVKYGCNSAFQKLWQEWNPSIKYPNGSLLQIGDVVYLIQKGQKRAFTSRGSLLANYNLNDIIPVPVVVGEQYNRGADINFPNYTLIQNPAGTVYLLVDGSKRGFSSSEVFKSYGYNPEEIIQVEWSAANGIPEGEKITKNVTYPEGALLQNQSTGAIFYINSKGKKRPIWSVEVLDNNYPNKIVDAIAPEELKQYPFGSPMKLRDGTLVTSKKDTAVYVIANGRRRPFKSAEIFAQYGYKWENIITVPHKVLLLHPTGKYIK